MRELCGRAVLRARGEQLPWVCGWAFLDGYRFSDVNVHGLCSGEIQYLGRCVDIWCLPWMLGRALHGRTRDGSMPGLPYRVIFGNCRRVKLCRMPLRQSIPSRIEFVLCHMSFRYPFVWPDVHGMRCRPVFGQSWKQRVRGMYSRLLHHDYRQFVVPRVFGGVLLVDDRSKCWLRRLRSWAVHFDNGQYRVLKLCGGKIQRRSNTSKERLHQLPYRKVRIRCR